MTSLLTRRWLFCLLALLLILYFVVTPIGLACVLMSQGPNDEQSAVEAALLESAHQRITLRLGEPRAKPAIRFFDEANALYSNLFNHYGSTMFLPHKTCIVIGPQGSNIDVVAHELVHAELVHRIGFWQRLQHIPTWFDEGLGMQVDDRQKYQLNPEQRQAIDLTPAELETGRQFFSAQNESLTFRYGIAKHWVGRWLERLSPSTGSAAAIWPLLEEMVDAQALGSLREVTPPTTAGSEPGS